MTAVTEAKESREEAKPAENKPESNSNIVDMTMSPTQETKDDKKEPNHKSKLPI